MFEGDDSEVSIFVDLIMSAIGRGGVYHRGFGIKKRYWFGGGGGGGRSRILGSRPAFMEPLQGVPQGVPPPRDGNYVRLVGGGEGVPPPRDGYERGELGGGGEGVSGRGGGPLRVMRRSRSSSSFPLKDDAGYIGYLSDDESVGGSGGEGGDVMRVVERRRRELLGSDISFSNCLLLMITVGGLLMLFMFAVSPWGVPPPRRL